MDQNNIIHNDRKDQLNEIEPENKSIEEKISPDLKTRLKLICLGLFVGDSLGATSEFEIPWFVLSLTFDRSSFIAKY